MNEKKFNISRKYLILALFVAGFFIFIPNFTQAHPGRTASDGCHYCRTNCSSWGYTTGTRHCHDGGSSVPAVKYETPKTSVVETKELEKQIENKTEKRESTVLGSEEKNEINEVPEKVEEEIPEVKEIKKEPQTISSVQKTENNLQDNNSGGGWFWPLVIGGVAGFFIKSKIDKKK